jgi:phosphomannomutase
MNIYELIVAASNWMGTDPDPETRAQTARMIASQDEAELRRFFGERLRFGTAGIRGPIGPGPGGLNQAMARQVAAGLGAHLQSQLDGEVSVVVGFDGRHKSLDLARDTAAVLGAMGIEVHLFEGVVPTPLLAFALRHLGCAAGVMVTASHNPPQDNGIKVYWGDGAQIVPPHDTEISARIERIHGHVATDALKGLRLEGRLHRVPDRVRDSYIAAALELRVRPLDAPSTLGTVYTAMHGVGHALLADVLAAAGHPPLHVVVAQRDPDPDFPTVSFPNPEEPGALDLAQAEATASQAHLIIAHDPDADRLAVAVPDGGGWRRLTGNEIGLILADELLSQGEGGSTRMVATTIVSTARLAALAKIHGVSFAETLTGFKWIAHAAMAHDGPFVLGFEEALGYSVGELVRDKDGISAALVLLDLAAHLHRQGQGLLDRLAEIYAQVGCARTRQHAVTLTGPEGRTRIEALMSGLRADPLVEVAGVEVRRVRDLAAGTCRDLQTGELSDETLPRSNVLAYELADGSRVLARPSGTEPKVKLYFEACVPMSGSLAEAEAAADARLDALEADVLAHVGL